MLHFFQCTQSSNHSSTECKTNYGVKFNFIGIKKTEGVPKFFLKGRQINFLKLLYIKKKKFRSGWSWDHPGLKVASPLREREREKICIEIKISFLKIR